MSGDRTMKTPMLAQAFGDERAPARRRDGRARHPADQRVRRRGRQPEPPRDEVPADRAHEAGEDHRLREDVLHDDVLRDRAGDMRAEDQERGEVEERRPCHREARRQDARRDDGRDRVRCVVESVDEVERERDQDDDDERGRDRRLHACSSRVLQDDRLDRVRDVLEGVDRGFELLDHVPVPEDLEALVVTGEQVRDGLAVDLVTLVLEAVDLDPVLLEPLKLCSRVERVVGHRRCADEDVRLLRELRRGSVMS